MEGPLSVPRDLQLNRANPSCQLFLVGAVPMAVPVLAPLVPKRRVPMVFELTLARAYQRVEITAGGLESYTDVAAAMRPSQLLCK